MKHWLACLAVLFLCSAGQANIYFQHTRNENLKERLRLEPWRGLPSGERYSLALDAYLYKPWGAEDFYYHGNGYWINALAEARPHDDLALNLKLIAYNGASSYAYAHSDFIQPLFGMTWQPAFLPPGWSLRMRYMDLDRQTLGAGLLLEEVEMAGFAIATAYEQWRYRLIIDGTGGFYRVGDLYYQQIDWKRDLLGLSYTFIAYENEDVTLVGRRSGPQSVGRTGIPAATLFSKVGLTETWFLRTEAGYRNGQAAGLVGVRAEIPLGKFRAAWDLHFRRYGRGFAEQIAGFIEHEYVNPETADKSFTDPKNILYFGDDVSTASTRLDFTYRYRPWMEFGSSNELYRYFYAAETRAAYLYKHNVSFCPYAGREQDCLSLFVANKVANARDSVRFVQPPLSLYQIFNFGIEAFLYF